jgi:hypothetical protein
VYIEGIDEDFRREYETLFSDGLRAYQDGRADLYRVSDGPGGLVLTPQEDR